MNKSRLSIILIALIVSSLFLFGTVNFGKAQSALVAPTVTSAPATVDQGQNATLSSTAVTTGVSPYTYQWFEKAPNKSYVKVGTSSASYSFITSASNATGIWNIVLQVTDSTGAAVNSTAVSVTVDLTLVAPTVTSAPATVDQGQTATLSSTPVNTGSGGYTYQWFEKAPSEKYAKVGTGSASYNFVTSSSTTTGSWSVILQVTDSAGATVNSTASSVTVDPALAAPTVTSASATVDRGQTATLSSTAVTAGTSPYTYQWFAKAPSKNYATVGTDSTSYNFVTGNSTTAGSWSFTLQVTDSTGTTVNSTAASVTVDATLAASTVTAAPVKVNQGQTATLSSTAVTTGSGVYTYQWFAKAPSKSYVKVGTDSASYSFITSGSNATGKWSFILQVTDSTGAAMNSTAALVTVHARPLLPSWASDLLIAVVIAVLLIIILFAWRRRARKMGRNKNQPAAGAIAVTEVEVANNTVKFFAAKGFRKKQRIVVKEIPVLEIEHIENRGNELSVTWKGATYSFFTTKKTDLFSKLVDQVNVILAEDQRKSKENKEKEEKTALRGNELLGAINSSVGIIDQSFNVLIGLQEKHINWEQLEGYANDFGKNSGFAAQTMPPLNIDFAKIGSAVKTEIPKETSNEAYSILKATYGYFNGLNIDSDFKDTHPNFNDAKTLISAYLMLNDLLLGKAVGDKENNEEISQLESVLQNLAAETNFKVDIEELKNIIDKIDVNSNKQKAIERSREIFKQQLKQQFKPKEKSLTTTMPVAKEEVTVLPIEPAAKEITPEPIEPISKEEVTVQPIEPAAKELTAEPTVKDVVSTEPTEPVVKETIPATIEPASKEISVEPVAKDVVSTEPIEPAAKVIVAEPAVKGGQKLKAIKVSKVEVSDNIAKFSAAEGLFKKQWVVVGEIPLREIEHIDKFGNEVTVTWKGATYTFFSKEKTDLFGKFVNQVKEMLERASTETGAPPKEGAQPAPEGSMLPGSGPEVQD